MIEIISYTNALCLLLLYISWGLGKNYKTSHNIGIYSLSFAIIFAIGSISSLYYIPEEPEEIFLIGVASISLLYGVFFLVSLFKVEPIFKELSRVSVDILLLLGLLFAYKYTDSPYVEDLAFWIIIFYIGITESLVFVGKNDKPNPYDSATHTLKKGYLLNIEEVDKELSLLIVMFATIAFSGYGWLSIDFKAENNSTPIEFEIRDSNLKNITVLDKISNIKNLEVSFEEGNKINYQGLKKPAYQELFNYQLSIFVLTLLMLIFSAVKFSLKRDELTKKENKRVELASRGRYGEYYGCNNTLLWETRRRSIRDALKKEFYPNPKDNTFDTKFFSKESFDFSTDCRKKWDYFCQLASAYYSHAISLQKLNKKDKNQDIEEYLLKAFYIYENLPEKKDNYSDEYYHHIDLCNDLYLLSIEASDENDELRKMLIKFFTENDNYQEKLKQSTNYKFNKILKILQNNSDFDAAIEDLNNISEGLEDKKQNKAASKHKKTIELLSALNNAHNYENMKAWVDDFKNATGHIDKNVEKFKAKRFDAPANLFITTTGVIVSIVAIISILEIFDYSKVINIEIFALSGGVLSMVFAFIFKSIIESFFASLQMYLSDMLRIGDRIKCEALSIDGYVSGFGFSSIDFQNLDNSNIKVPARDLIEKTFSNLRTLPENGRRIEIKLTFSANSINVFTPKDVEEIKRNVDDMGPYLDCKLKSMISFNCKSSKKDEDGSEGSACYKEAINVKGDDLPSKRFLSNLGSFRAYAEQYLFEHQWLNDGASPMAVIYDTSAEGVTVLFTAYSQPDDRFVRTKAFMNLESDIVEHLITTSRCFGLKLHQTESESKVSK
jgi:small-conductance mechanosensitive channel